MPDRSSPNFGLWLGDDESPNADNVVIMTEALWRALPQDILDGWMTDPIGSPTKHDDLPAEHKAEVWQILGREGNPPRMRLVVSGKAIEAAVESVRKQPTQNLAETVQAKLDSYKTNKQRRKRLKALKSIREETVTLDIAIEVGVLEARLDGHHIITAQEMSDTFRRMAEEGRMPLFVTIAGETHQVPQEVIDRGKRK